MDYWELVFKESFIIRIFQIQNLNPNIIKKKYGLYSDGLYTFNFN